MDAAALAPAPLTVALVAGAVAAFNPCGFALLPAYLALLVAGPVGVGRADGRTAAVVRALRFTTGMTAGFVTVFGGFALVVAPLALSLERWLPVLTVVMGVGLVVLGGWLIAGRTLALPRVARWRRAPTATWSSQVGYGVTFALASLSCTVAPFLAVTTNALREGSAAGVAAVFVAYAFGMGAVVGVLAVAAALASATVTTSLRRVAPYVSRGSGVLLVVAGAYVAWYGWFELRVLAGAAVEDPVVSAAIQVQSALSRSVAGVGAGALGIAALGLLAVAVGTAAARAARRRSREIEEVRP
ncbi:MAG: cytochrome c biogenesis protein CcdA [Actinomycetota bacterium]|nr:cytochrome c biogenesis protein CcdA [Actinomycetota bacterium]